MNAIASIRSVPGSMDVREHAFAATAQPTPPRLRETQGELRADSFFAPVLRRILRTLEGRRLAEIARRTGPLSLDDAWAGDWYARSRERQAAVYQQACSTDTKPAPRRQDWDDRLD